MFEPLWAFADVSPEFDRCAGEASKSMRKNLTGSDLLLNLEVQKIQRPVSWNVLAKRCRHATRCEVFVE